MNEQKTLEIAKISNELWNDNLWYRQLDQEDKEAIAQTVWIMRNYNRIKAPLKFSAVFRLELKKMFDAWKQRM